MSFVIRPLRKNDLIAVKDFTDLTIGENYYSSSELSEIFERSRLRDQMCTLLLCEGQDIRGIRITYPPTKWTHGKGDGLSPEHWPYGLNDTAYFQSLFVAKELTGQGYGRQLSIKSIEILQALGAKGIVCHSWRESPNGSSGRYLRALGFQLIKQHPLYWNKVNYTCTRCGNPCLCTAEEMYLVISSSHKGNL